MTSFNKDQVAELLASGSFDSDWYQKEYPDVTLSDMTPAEHYLWLGKRIGRAPNPRAFRSLLPRHNRHPVHPQQSRPPFVSFGVIRHNPLISLLIVSYNSSADLETLFPSIAAQTYRNLEVVLIENGTENTEQLFRKYFPTGRYQSADNIGFADGNNLAVRLAEGELVALINPDTRLEPAMVQNLLDAIRYDSSAAVAVPKINFFERFIRVVIRSDQPFTIDRDELVGGLNYRKIFLRGGLTNGDDFQSDEFGVLAVDLPYIDPTTIRCTLRGIDKPLRKLHTQIGYSQPVIVLTEPSETMQVELVFDAENCSSARYIVNNAGSGVDDNGSPYDRGFAQIDDGEFFSKAYVDAFCGCAALIRRQVLIDRELFQGSFFAYYEDSEMSHWLKSQGFRILYQPEAVIYHRHSESTEENSILWKVLVGRSRQLYDIATGSDPLPPRYFKYDYPEEFTHPLVQKLINIDSRVRLAESMAQLVKPARPTACIYDTYFSSMGGGEKHALDIASLLLEKYDVFIVSEEDFSLAHLEEYFDVDLGGVRKIVSTEIDANFSSRFDVFVNATFRSNLISAAQTNLYVVSFPHLDIEQRLIDGAIFLHNSNYTARWSTEYWGEHRSEVVLPIIGQGRLFEGSAAIAGKEQVFLSVGRLTSEGHCKNHHSILDAYRKLIDRRPALANWKLQIVGSCNFADEASSSYLELLKKMASGYNVEILPNMGRTLLNETYRKAAVYIHAAGLGMPAEMPERHEHFGITTFEAMAHGCLPVVYEEGGPAGQVNGLQKPITFQTAEELGIAMEGAVMQIHRKAITPDDIRRYAHRMYEENLANARSVLLQDGPDQTEAEGQRIQLNRS